MSPRAVPQLADAHDVLAARRAPQRCPSSQRWLPNARGAERALGAGVDEIVCFVSASETHNQREPQRVDRRLACATSREIADIARGKASCCAARSLARSAVRSKAKCPSMPCCASSTRYAALGIDRFTLGDTTGMATPPTVARLVEAIRARFPGQLPIALHFHNTRGVGLANVMVGLDLGIREYESSIAGLGGCPFAPGATGNICTEDLVYLLEESGLRHGYRSRRADRRRPPRRESHRTPVAGTGDEGRAAAAQVFAGRRAARGRLIYTVIR